MNSAPLMTRRSMIGHMIAAPALSRFTSFAQASTPAEGPERPALVSISLDLEMSRHYPTWEQTHWDYEKGNLDGATKRYAVEAARRVKARGGRIHFFAVGRVLEQEDVNWLKELKAEGHPVGNHTYDHVNVKATRPDQLQFRFQRAPWLIEGKTASEVVSSNIAMTTRALRQRVDIEPAGFRTPGGFHDGLHDRPDVRKILLDQGFRWVSSLYPPHPLGPAGTRPDKDVFDGIVKAQAASQPFAYPDGLIEVPMSPISDVSALRSGRWPLADFVRAVRLGVEWAVANRAVYDFLGHPSCLVAADPDFRVIDQIMDVVGAAGDRARLVDLGEVASRVPVPPDPKP